jgi:hypothetical protein
MTDAVKPTFILDTSQLLNDLHRRHMAREFTASKFADLLGIPPLNLYDLLDEVGLPVRYY